MGKVEKLAVLAVLFLIAVILVVSMTTDNPIDKATASVLGEKPAVAQADGGAKPLEAQPNPGDPKLLSMTTKEIPPAQVAAAPQPMAIPTGSLLKTTEGLAQGFDSKRLLYTWQTGDSYVALARRLYGEPTKFTLIENANEGRTDMQPGDKILVPVYDVENVVEVETPTKIEGKSKSAKAAPVSAAGRTHTVKKGDSLWKIAKLELGDGNRWKEIYDLNKDKMKSPESLRDGMQLALP